MAPAAVFSKRSFSSSSHFLCHHSRPAERSHKALCCPSPATRSVRQRLAASFQCYSLLQAVKADAHSPKTLRKAQASWKIAWGQPSEALSWQGCQRWEYKRESCRRIYASGQESTVTSESVDGKEDIKPPPEPYKDGPMDVLFFKAFRRAMVREAGWDAPAPGYDGLIEVARKLVARHKSREETEDAAVRILQSLFPPFLLPAFRKIITPLGDGQPAAVLTAWVTQWSCQWLMGRCQVNDVQLADGTTQRSGVLVEKCKYLEESGCAGICVHTCKMPTQAFMKNDMGIPLTMEPNYEDYSCQFKFGVEPPSRDVDEALKVGCLSICPTAKAASVLAEQCPQVALN